MAKSPSPLRSLLFALGEEAGEVTTLNGAPAASFMLFVPSPPPDPTPCPYSSSFQVSVPSSSSLGLQVCSLELSTEFPATLWNSVVVCWDLLPRDGGKQQLLMSGCKPLSPRVAFPRQTIR